VARILVVDDDAHIRDVVRFALAKAGHEVSEAADGRAALVEFARSPVDLVVLDILMPEFDGSRCAASCGARARCRSCSSPAATRSSTACSGSSSGADDYVVKPFSPRELVARVKGILRRAQRSASEERAASEVIERGALRVDVDRHACTWAGRAVALTVTEFHLLCSLLGMPGKVYTREELVERAYGAGHHITDRTVDSHVRRIRKKFKQCGADPIETVYGLGYRLAVDDGNGG
jgi:two-component system OmpR family response regulator